jgi:RNA chaperone Hfq
VIRVTGALLLFVEPGRFMMVNRKLVRPNLAEIKEKLTPARIQQGPPSQGQSGREAPSGGGASGPRRRPLPPEQTSAEAFYYLKQMNNRTPMVVVLDNGEQLRGHIEWYDRACIKVNREGVPNLLVFKHAIKYLYKQEEEVETAKRGLQAER